MLYSVKLVQKDGRWVATRNGAKNGARSGSRNGVAQMRIFSYGETSGATQKIIKAERADY